MSTDTDDFDDDLPDRVLPHRAPMVLAFGVLGASTCSFPLFGVLAIVAWVLARRDLDQMRRGLMDRAGEQLTKTGYILGIVGTILFALYIMGFGAYLAFIIIMIAAH